MKERWLRCAGDELSSDRDHFDPAVAGRRHGLPDGCAEDALAAAFRKAALDGLLSIA